jgi:hypothetical protein
MTPRQRRADRGKCGWPRAARQVPWQRFCRAFGGRRDLAAVSRPPSSAAVAAAIFLAASSSERASPVVVPCATESSGPWPGARPVPCSRSGGRLQAGQNRRGHEHDPSSGTPEPLFDLREQRLAEAHVVLAEPLRCAVGPEQVVQLPSRPLPVVSGVAEEDVAAVRIGPRDHLGLTCQGLERALLGACTSPCHRCGCAATSSSRRRKILPRRTTCRRSRRYRFGTAAESDRTAFCSTTGHHGRRGSSPRHLPCGDLRRALCTEP